MRQTYEMEIKKDAPDVSSELFNYSPSNASSEEPCLPAQRIVFKPIQLVLHIIVTQLVSLSKFDLLFV